MTSPIVEARSLAVGWPGAAPLLEGVSFDVHRGEIFAILGGSGSGKSTLMRALIGLESPVSGEVAIAGELAPKLEARRPTFGVMFQQGALFGSLTVLQNVSLPLERWTDLPRDAVLAIARAKLRLVGLEEAGDKLPSELSGGMKKRAAIARALALEPSLVFLDEPSSGLDPVTSAGLDDLILTLKRALGLTVVIVTHELGSIFAIVDRCILLDHEQRGVSASGAPRELADSDQPKVRAFFQRAARAS
ncbi:MAG: ATP-binding cassette domain-containing protein [Polyangiaceae bacterium]|jgi:phospholipid/cholesterol/gamma-HCH transport system ATP-binding protein|nr:ATP-binding cassette domain-containing protein [Polyangiaceae bacterium]MBK8937262.1 ATP-binding cassette domain-containing protein [Polyangiaceae bacterium]